MFSASDETFLVYLHICSATVLYLTFLPAGVATDHLNK